LDAQSDEALIEAIAAGNQFAMRTLYTRHNARVARFITHLVTDTAGAEDLVNEVFIDVWSEAGRFEGRSRVSTWILSIARFKALSALRPRRETEVDEAAMETIVDTADTPEQTMLEHDRSVALRRCLAQMSRAHRGRIARSSISSIFMRSRSKRPPRSSACRRTR